MPPNTIDIPMGPTDGVIMPGKPMDQMPPQSQRYEERYTLCIILSTVNLLAHIMIGMTLTICLMFAFRSGLPVGSTPIHIVLCVMGYHLLMAEATMSLCPENGWSSKMTLVHKRRAHWILQLTGSILAIAGSIYKMSDKENNWETGHGKLGIVAMGFTSVSLVNGCASLWAYELRRFLPGNLSKLTHICFGVVAFVLANICLIFGMRKQGFRSWATDNFVSTFTYIIGFLAIIVVVFPLISFYNKVKIIVKK